MEHVEFTHTSGMDREAVVERLEGAETGVLSLADDGDAYAVPVAFHYDGGDSILLRLGRAEDSEKMGYLESTRRACFVVYEYRGPRDSWSVVATGELRRVPADDDRYDPATINRRFSDIRVFGEDVGDLEVELYEIGVERVTGRETLGG